MQDSETGVVCVKGKAELAASVNAISLRRRGWVGDGESGRGVGGGGGVGIPGGREWGNWFSFVQRVDGDY